MLVRLMRYLMLLATGKVHLSSECCKVILVQTVFRFPPFTPRLIHRCYRFLSHYAYELVIPDNFFTIAEKLPFDFCQPFVL